MPVTRFAPSPNGPLHLGHAYSAIRARDLAGDGEMLLRIEDIDGPRSRPEHAEAFRRDLAWLGIAWREVAPQSARLESYRAAAEALQARGLLYACHCTRRQIAAAGGKDGRYPGTCRAASVDPETAPVAWRLDARAALAEAGPLEWVDERAGAQSVDPATLDDVVLVRKDLPASYHLAATLDDAEDGVTLVTRGMDLFDATPIHRLLQALLELPVPRWHHHSLLLDGSGKKLAKRRGSPSLADRRQAGEDGRLLAMQLATHRFPSGITLADA